MNDDKQLVIEYYKSPPRWTEWSIYIGILVAFAGAVVNQSVFLMALITGFFMYWNYMLFTLIRSHVAYRNVMNFKELIADLSLRKLNDEENGTIPESEGLTKEQGNDQEPDG